MRYPPELIIRVLTRDEWPKLAEWMEDEYGLLMPLADNPHHLFYGVFMGATPIGFAHLETLVHLDKVFIAEGHRNAGLLPAIFETIDDEMPEMTPMLIHPDKPFQRLLRRFGFRPYDTPNSWRRR